MDNDFISIEDKIEELNKYFSGREKILAVWIIGSYGTQFFRWNSDIDFAVLYDGEISSSDLLEEAGNIVKITGCINIDVMDIRCEPVELQYKIIKETRLIFNSGNLLAEEYIKGILEICERCSENEIWGRK